jgi:hypothetical protein
MNDLLLERERILEELASVTPGTEGYMNLLKQLHQLETIMNERPGWRNVKVWDILTRTVQIAMVLNFERLNIVRTKAFAMIKK